jgi:UDPglucose 6-dehydrogenase
MAAGKPVGPGETVKVVVFGLWHLGCVTAACGAEHFAVVGLDFDPEIIANLRRGRAPIFEPGLNELIQSGLRSERLRFTTDEQEALENVDVFWVCYDTPVDESDVPDVGFVIDRIERCLPYLRPGAIVLISSQLPAGTCRRLEQKHADEGISFACSPENLRLGKALDIFRNPDRVVVGVRDARPRKTIAELFAPFASDRVLWMSPESAEMTKHAINAFLALSVTFANEIARLCEVVGANAREVEEGLRSESRIGPKAYIRAGSAFAGGTLARDVVTVTRIAADHGESAELIAAILRSNEAHKAWALRRLEAIYGNLRSITVAVLGLTYKPGTDTLRRSSAIELCLGLLERGARVRCYDPVVKALPSELAAAKICESLPDALRQAEAAVIATEWPQIRDADWPALVQTMKQPPVILDANRFLNLTADALQGGRYFAVGSSIS